MSDLDNKSYLAMRAFAYTHTSFLKIESMIIHSEQLENSSRIVFINRENKAKIFPSDSTTITG